MGGLLDAFGFRSREAVSAPVFDGVLRPNQRLDLCRLLGRGLGQLDDIAVSTDGTPLITVENRVMALAGHWFAPLLECVSTFGGRCEALAALDDGAFVVAVANEGIVVEGGRHHGTRWTKVAGQPLRCVTAIAAQGKRLIVSEGSATNRTDAWRRDLFEGNASGRVVELDLETGACTTLAEGLAWASGVAVAPDGTVVCSEAWAHRLVVLCPGGGRDVGFESIPAYPGRLAPAQGGGYWLSCFAARTQLVEFVLANRALTTRMMREIEERYWIAPSLAETDHPFEATQMGGIKQYGVKKPWAPPRSYGLVVRLDADFAPSASLHSRVDGKRHGITGVAVAGSNVFIVAKGHGKVLLHEEGDAQ